MLRIVVAGALANKSGNGGEAWVRLSYLRGFRRLGCSVSLVEEIAHPAPDAVDYFRQVTKRFGVPAALVGPDGAPIVGEPPEEGDVLVNVSGNLRAPSLLGRFRRRAYVDLDPGFTQVWHAQGSLNLSGHDVYFTVGGNVGRPGCPIPSGGIRWRPTRPPVVLDDWPAANGGFTRFTTVATWRGPFGPVEHGGRRYGVKLHEFRKVIELPERSPHRFELALAIDAGEDGDLATLHRHGWRIVDPRAVAGSPDDFRDYVRGSGAEFSASQGIYVDTRSGWFSDRTARYLAAGRPALVQDTGFGDNLPVGEGLLAFRTLEEAAAGAELIASDYARHARAARALAEEHLDSDQVLARLLEEVLP